VLAWEQAMLLAASIRAAARLLAGRRVYLRPTLTMVCLLWLGSPPAAHSYSVLTHEQLIDLSWNPSIAPLLRARFPSLTPEQLREAHSYAYGGCVIQDLGYYPFGNSFFSDLTHYVRSGDFVNSLFRNAQTADELAFAIGALTHYIGDSIGHSVATNRSVPVEFPKLRARYGPSVSYAQGKNAHDRVEFAFDISQIVKQRLPPAAYLHYIGFRVPRRQLALAFAETYGLKIGSILGLYDTAIRSYRSGARSFIPSFAYAEALVHRGHFPPDTAGPELEFYEENMNRFHPEANWHKYRKKAGVRTYLLAALIIILPKIGPLSLLSIKGPTTETEKLYLESVNRSTEAINLALQEFSAPERVTARALPSFVVPNRDLDTGMRVLPGGYPLTDQTYAKLLERLTKNRETQIPAGLKQDILQYYSDPQAPIITKRDPKEWARVQQDLQVLLKSPTRGEPD
jgi:Zinc dependent phospholipase C